MVEWMAGTAESAEGFDTTIECTTQNGESVFTIDDRKVTISKLSASDTLTCTYTNVEIIPPTGTLTLFKSVTSDNNVGMPMDSEFGLTVTGITDAQFATPMVVNANEPITIEIGEPLDYSRVIISGDNCPAVSDFDGDDSAVVTLEDGENRICTFYYDDEFQDNSGGDGIIFHRNSLSFNPGATDCSVPDEVGACIEPGEPLFGEVNTFVLRDPALDADADRASRTIVPFTLVPSDPLTFGLLPCEVSGIADLAAVGNSGIVTILTCEGAPNFEFNLNYAFIQTPEV